MSDAAIPLSGADEDSVELAGLKAAVKKARADERGVSHTEMRTWLLEIAAGDFKAKPPVSRKL